MADHTLKNLETALGSVFPADEAACLARLMESFGEADTAYYEAIDLPAEEKDDAILMAVEERLLLPRTSRPGGAWEDRMLTLAPGALYIMPRVVRSLMDIARESGRFEPDAAIRRTLAEKDDQQAVKRLIAYFNSMKPHAAAYKIEAGLLAALNHGPDPISDLHEAIDLFVLVGMMSPATRGPTTSGLSWYELNPALYWGEGE